MSRAGLLQKNLKFPGNRLNVPDPGPKMLKSNDEFTKKS